MGYTMYWRQPVGELDKVAWNKLAGQMKLLCEDFELDTGHKIVGRGESDVPVFSDEEIIFNGAGANGLEHFVLHRVIVDSPKRYRDYPDGRHFDFCKTCQLPYDLMVKVSLILFKAHFGDIVKVTTDDGGRGYIKEWTGAKVFLGRKLGAEIDLVWSGRELQSVAL